jgi:hypothetical protein
MHWARLCAGERVILEKNEHFNLFREAKGKFVLACLEHFTNDMKIIINQT